MPELVLERQDQINAMKPRIIHLKDYAQTLDITTAETNKEAGTQLLTISEFEKAIREYHRPDVKRADELHKSLVAKRETMLSGVKQIKETIKDKMLGWDEKERKRLALIRAEAEEKQRKADEKARAKAKALEKKGKPEKAKAVLDNTPIVPLPSAEPEKEEGIGYRETWKARAVDITKIPPKYIIRTPDQSLLNALAKSSEGKAKVPGVEFYLDKTIIPRRQNGW